MNQVDKTPCPRGAFVLVGETHQGVNYNSVEGDKYIEKINQGKGVGPGCTFNFRMIRAGIFLVSFVRFVHLQLTSV